MEEPVNADATTGSMKSTPKDCDETPDDRI